MINAVVFAINYFETMIPFFVLALLTIVWFVRVDSPRLESRTWVRAGPIPLTHHWFEVPAFFFFGWAMHNVGFPIVTLPIFIAVIAAITYPLVHQFESTTKSKDSRGLLVLTFLGLEAAMVVGFSI